METEHIYVLFSKVNKLLRLKYIVHYRFKFRKKYLHNVLVDHFR